MGWNMGSGFHKAVSSLKKSPDSSELMSLEHMSCHRSDGHRSTIRPWICGRCGGRGELFCTNVVDLKKQSV